MNIMYRKKRHSAVDLKARIDQIGKNLFKLAVIYGKMRHSTVLCTYQIRIETV
jgi:hypothetical protein